jgi:hypothetical protein
VKEATSTSRSAVDSFHHAGKAFASIGEEGKGGGGSLLDLTFDEDLTDIVKERERDEGWVQRLCPRIGATVRYRTSDVDIVDSRFLISTRQMELLSVFLWHDVQCFEGRCDTLSYCLPAPVQAQALTGGAPSRGLAVTYRPIWLGSGLDFGHFSL